jgi:DNA-binding MarR family transcriptional regulator
LPFDPVAEARRHWEEHGWAPAAANMAAVTSVMRAQQIFLARVDATLKPFGLTFARFELLALLSFTRTGALPLGKIGDRLQVHAASVTNAVDRLEASGLVARTAHLEDRRITLAAITGPGRRLVARATQALNAGAFADIGLDGDQVERLIAILAQVRAACGDFAQPEAQDRS